MHRLDLGLYFHPKEFWGNGDRTHVNSKGKISCTGKILSEEDRTHNAASSRAASPTHYERAILAPSVHSVSMTLAKLSVQGFRPTKSCHS